MNNYSVYKHTNKINNKVYIGITSQEPTSRWKNGLGYQTQRKFYRAILKYGWDNFSHEVLFINLTKEEACKKEKELIKKFNSIDNGYNSLKGGEVENLGKFTGQGTKEAKLKKRKEIYKKQISRKFFWLNKRYPTEEEYNNFTKDLSHKDFILWNKERELTNLLGEYIIFDIEKEKTIEKLSKEYNLSFDENGFII